MLEYEEGLEADKMTEKRHQNRIPLDATFTVYYREEPCRVADISKAGLGITFIGDEDWPEEISLEYRLQSDETQRMSIQCRTVWESSMSFYKTAKYEIIRRRGLEFVEPDSGAIKTLQRHMESLV